MRKKIQCKFHSKRSAEREIAHINKRADLLRQELEAELAELKPKKRIFGIIRPSVQRRIEMLEDEMEELERQRQERCKKAWDVHKEVWGDMAH